MILRILAISAFLSFVASCIASAALLLYGLYWIAWYLTRL